MPTAGKLATSITKLQWNVKVFFQVLICSALARPNVCITLQRNEIKSVQKLGAVKIFLLAISHATVGLSLSIYR